MKEMQEIEKQAHLLERIEKSFDTFIQEYDISRISVLGAIEALKLKIIANWHTQDIIPDEIENEDED